MTTHELTDDNSIDSYYSGGSLSNEFKLFTNGNSPYFTPSIYTKYLLARQRKCSSGKNFDTLNKTTDTKGR